MIAAVGDNELVGLVDGNKVGILELALSVAERTKLANVVAVGLEDLHSVIVFVADVDESLIVDHHSPRVVEFAVRLTVRAELANEFSVRFEYLQNKVAYNAVLLAIGWIWP